MENRKRFIISISLAILSLSLVLCTLFVPMVHLIAKDTNKNVVFDGVVNIIDYSKKAVFLSTDAFDVYFEATGPMWLAATAVMLNFLVVVFAIVMVLVFIFESSTIRFNGLITRQNVLAKKIAIVSGFFGAFVFVFNIVAYLVTTSMANGYVEFYPGAQCYIGLALCVAIIVLGFLHSKKDYPQNKNKIRDAIGFALTAIFVALAVGLFFIPQFNKYFLYGKPISFWTLGKQAVLIPQNELPIGGDYPIGFSQWAILAIIVLAVFIFIYSVIGFILTLRGKNANWLSVRVKRWSVAFLAFYFVFYMLILAGVSVITTNIFLDEGISVLLPISYIALAFPFMPIICSCCISQNKPIKIKDKKN